MRNMSVKEIAKDRFNTAELETGVKNLVMVLLDEKELSIFEQKYRDEATEYLAYQARMQLEGKEPWGILLSWSGTKRLPTGLVVDNKVVAMGQRGELLDSNGGLVANYIRIEDDFQSDSPRQKMLVFGS